MLNNHHGDGDQLNNNIKEQQLIAEKSRDIQGQNQLEVAVNIQAH